jgi:hypothetical protein
MTRLKSLRRFRNCAFRDDGEIVCRASRAAASLYVVERRKASHGQRHGLDCDEVARNASLVVDSCNATAAARESRSLIIRLGASVWNSSESR